MKNFKDILSEVSQPKSAEERRFKDMHQVELIKHPVALDSQFTGEIEGVTKKKRPADQEGDTNYDKAYAVKDKPFKMPRDIDESIELEEEQFSNWSVEIPAQQGIDKKHTVTVKARNTREAAKKAASRVGLGDRWMSMKLGKITKMASVQEASENQEEVITANESTKKQTLSFKDLKEKVSTEQDLLENPQEEIPMMMRQLHFISYAADEIMEYLAIDGLDPEEWWQNKLAYAFAQMKSLHAYVEGDKHMMDMDDEDELEASYMAAAYESVEAGEFVLENKDIIEITEEDAELLSLVFESLHEDNKNDMYNIMIESKDSFEEVLQFARDLVTE